MFLYQPIFIALLQPTLQRELMDEFRGWLHLVANVNKWSSFQFCAHVIIFEMTTPSPAVTLNVVLKKLSIVNNLVKSTFVNRFQYSPLFNTALEQLLSWAQCAGGVYYLAPRQQLVWVISGMTRLNLVTSGLEHSPQQNSDGLFPWKCFLQNKCRIVQLQRFFYLVLQRNNLVEVNAWFPIYRKTPCLGIGPSWEAHAVYNVCEDYLIKYSTKIFRTGK